MSDFNSKNFKYDFKNFIGIYENAFTKKECKDIINLFEKYHSLGYTSSRNLYEINSMDDISINLKPSLEIDWNSELISSFHDRFYNYIYPVYNHQYPVLQKLEKHKSKHIKVQKTYPTQGYHAWHCEHSAYFKDRLLSWILYLNDVEDGGETEFLYQSMRIKPKTGTFILFPAHFTHTHRGNPPLSEVKYVATGWVEFLNTTEIQGFSDEGFFHPKIKTIDYQ